MTISLSDRFVASPTVLFRELEGESVLLNLESGVYYGLDPVGTRIWTLLAGDESLSGVCDILQREFDVAPDVLQSDVQTLVTELCGKGLVVLKPVS